MQFIRNSIGAKVLILTSLLTIAAFTGLFLANSYWQRSSTVEEIKYSAERTADLLQMAIEEPMALGDNEGTVDQFHKVSEREKDVKIFLTDFDGEVTYSTLPDSVKKNVLDLAANRDFKNIVSKSLKEPIREGEVIEVFDGPHFVEVQSIKNEPQCHHCHGKTKHILGSMVMCQDVSRQFKGLASDQLKSGLISLAGMAALLIALIVFMKTAVINKIQSITETTEEIAKGDLNARFTVTGIDEMGKLSTYLSDMVSKIKDQLEYNKSILNGIIVPLLVADNEGRIEFTNVPLRTILGKSESEVLGQTVSRVLTGQEGSGETAKVIEAGKSVSGNMKYTRADGVEFPLHYEISPLRDADNNIVGSIEVLIDLTQEEKDRANIEAQRKNLLEVANQVTEVAMKLSSASEELSRQMEEVTGSVDTTANQTSQVATAMEEMNATVLEVAKNAGNTAEASEKSNKVAKEGGDVVAQTMKEIHQVATTTEKLATSLSDLSERAENIGRVMAVINDIADQTNLLALNAAIEAARAGEAGRGFAVVADEVRKLAEKTMSATKEVEQAIHLIQQSTTEVVDEMTGAQERVVKTASMAEQAGGVLTEIVKQADSIADMVRNIATAAEQQSTTSDEINTNVTQINSLSQDISLGVSEANSAIQEVAEMAQILRKLVERFK